MKLMQQAAQQHEYERRLAALRGYFLLYRYMFFSTEIFSIGSFKLLEIKQVNLKLGGRI